MPDAPLERVGFTLFLPRVDTRSSVMNLAIRKERKGYNKRMTKEQADRKW